MRIPRKPCSTDFALAACAVLAAAVPGACTSPDKPAETSAAATRPEPAAPLPWTTEFQQKSALIADEVSIEGPPGLVDHVAFKQFPEQKYEARTIEAGFLQEVAVPDDAPNPIWIQIDNLAINAVRRARVLERVTEGPVVIRARGQVVWKNLETGAERKSDALELVGARPR